MANTISICVKCECMTECPKCAGCSGAERDDARAEERARWEDAIAWMFQLRDNLTDAIHQLRVAYDDERKPGDEP